MITVTLSVKDVPAAMARRLKARAARNHRSLQGELLAILTEASQVTSASYLAALVRQLDLAWPVYLLALATGDTGPLRLILRQMVAHQVPPGRLSTRFRITTS